jgi:uncharacterized protein YodC (DUF2158 family)
MDRAYGDSLSHEEEDAMAFEPGDVVFLKSGGQSLTVATVDDDNLECIWMGEEGELFRETLPSVVLTKAPDMADEDIDEEDVGDEDLGEEEDEAKKPKRQIA